MSYLLVILKNKTLWVNKKSISIICKSKVFNFIGKKKLALVMRNINGAEI